MNLIQDLNPRIQELVPPGERLSTHAFAQDGEIVLIVQRKASDASRFVTFRSGNGVVTEIMSANLDALSRELPYAIPAWVRAEINSTQEVCYS